MYFSPKLLSNWQLYNGCTDGKEPDWARFQQLELRPVSQGPEFCEVLPPKKAHKATFWSIYARDAEGEVEVITDISNERDIQHVVTHLSARSGLPFR